ncbi:epsin [Maudiozyma humilis]|uniref:Epsin n=1 Tax=Maudiozyma humilis TaxID=51915 RepID=A0AAV5S199_MAUHU|nr:epsin [Kazachstania humilis]
MSKQFARSAKNVFKGYSSAQVLVRDATANDDRGTNIGALQEIAARTYDSVAFFEIMDMLDKRLNDKGKYWRHVVKALTVLDYLVRFGSENCVLWCKENLYVIKTLKEFRYLDDTGYDQGQIIRVKATDLTSLLADDERLRGERRHNQSRNYGRRRNDAPANPPDYNDAESPRRRRANSRAGYSRPEGPPRSSTTEDDDLRRAIEESKRTVEEDDERRKQIAQYEDEDPEFQAALQLSKEEEELKRLQDMQRLQQQQYLLQQQTGVAAPQDTGVYVDMFGNPISAQEYNEYQQQQTLWEQQQQQQQQMAQQQYAAQQQQLQQQQMMEQQQQMQMQQQQMMEQERLQQQQMQQQQQAQYAAQMQQPMETGSNNPFAINNTGVNAPQQQPAPQQVQSPPQQAYNTMPDVASPPSQVQAPPQVQSPPQQPLQRINTGNEAITQKYSQLNSMLANGTGTDTFGNTGEQRIPAQHTATGTFINSQGTGYHQETNEPKNNPFLTSQYTGLPSSGIVPLHTGYGFGNQGPQDDQPQAQSQSQQQQPQPQQQSQPLQQQQTQYTQFVQNPAQQQQQQTGYPQPPQFQTPNQYQQQQQPNQYQQQPNQYQQQPNQQTPDQGVSLIDL